MGGVPNIRDAFELQVQQEIKEEEDLQDPKDIKIVEVNQKIHKVEEIDSGHQIEEVQTLEVKKDAFEEKPSDRNDVDKADLMLH